MLRSVKNLERCAVHATDGDIGHVADILLDDGRWVVRYLVVKAGGFFGGRKVLISPISFREVDWPARRFHLALTREKVKQSPSIDTDLPVSRQLERDYYRYYAYPYYWVSSGIWGAGAHPNSRAVDGWSTEPEPEPDHEAPQEAQLRSARELTGYQIHGDDGTLGELADFLVDDETWEVRYLVLDTSTWWTEGKQALVSPRWATSVSWGNREVRVDLTRQSLQTSPAWNGDPAMTRDFEAKLHRHHRRPAYWDDGGFSEERWYATPPHDSHHSA
jgi:hypothetical protein